MKGLRLRPDEKGLRYSLFDLEADIMEAVWSAEWAEFSVSDVHERLAASREIAYTTVMTTVSRLFEKGVLRRMKDGRRYLYAPVFTRAAFARRMAQAAFDRLTSDNPATAMTLLIERVADADVAALDAIEAMIQARREKVG